MVFLGIKKKINALFGKHMSVEGWYLLPVVWTCCFQSSGYCNRTLYIRKKPRRLLCEALRQIQVASRRETTIELVIVVAKKLCEDVKLTLKLECKLVLFIIWNLLRKRKWWTLSGKLGTLTFTIIISEVSCPKTVHSSD